MNFMRIQDKMISREKIMGEINRILEMRAQGFSQQEVAERVGIDRTFVSRLETLGEIRKGQTIAVIGFPVQNKEEIEELLVREGVDYIRILTEKERTDYANSKTGAELLNEIMDIIATIRKFDVVIMLASDYRLHMARGLLDNEVISIKIGESPLKEDKPVDPRELQQVLRAVKGARKRPRTQDGRTSQ